ncbi:MAG: prepilin peptidase [Thermoguttaceae bacterium]|nr:prepilin peptidase [Thermoguttaceae bacterium]MDW8039524.1 prepilin peptidase [Thermoguttaceae bacterium]
MCLSGWQWVVLVFLAAVGGVIGSFLNVVIYRLPAGRSIIWPGSCCPACGRPIRWYDNVPVLSWFLLRGRCRDCRTPISWRYPAVEAITMGLFVLLGLWEWMSGGQHLPVRPIRIDGSVLWLPWTAPQLTALYVYHLMLGCTLLAATLIEYDHPKVSGRVWVRLFWPAFVWGFGAAFVWPAVHPVPAFGPAPEGWAGRLLGLIDSLVGLGAGTTVGLVWCLMAGLLIGPSWKNRANPGVWISGVGSSGLVGLYLGWQAGLAVGGISGLLWCLACILVRYLRMARKTFPPTDRAFPIPLSAWLGLSSLLWILFWKHWLDWAARVF